MRFLRIISGIILGFAPITLGVFFGILVYIYQPNFIGWGAIALFSLIGIWGGCQIFKIVKRIGFVAFITAINSTSHIGKD